MFKRLSACFLLVTPLQRVAIMWRKNIAKLVSVVGVDENSRRLCINVNLQPVIRLFLYIPRVLILVLHMRQKLVIVSGLSTITLCKTATIVIGYMNFQCSASSRGFNIYNNVWSGYDIANCDDLLQCDDGDKFTYCNDNLGPSIRSLIMLLYQAVCKFSSQMYILLTWAPI